MPEQDTKKDKRAQLLEAALETYARFGIHKATVRQIADIAGIGKSTVFEYFKSSAELMDAAFAHLIGQSVAGRAKLLSNAAADPTAAIEGYFDSLTGLILDEPQKLLLVSQYVTAILASGADFAEVKRSYGELLQPSAFSLLEDFRQIAEAGIRSGAFHPVGSADPQDMALMLSAIAREMQAQAFVQDANEIRGTCLRLKRIAFRMLGARDGSETEG